MEQQFFLQYLSRLSKEQAAAALEECFDIGFDERDSAYFGVYFVCRGGLCDRLTIKSNADPDGDLAVNNPNIRSITDFSFIEGTNADKEAKYRFAKERMAALGGAFILSQDNVYCG